ncbi:hypothetical protein PtA15_5A34 [Puccinia triticina]|uniref:Uncharacterized protein n=1 Tax=Puccinia triticina TaxID=208348 RepID=A0ABY7CGU1_9BASI|nr:uncharacterized protein PtA15_5A34 [Puccinia triticina]WAQ84464.1 hypothetical protein PtA15_5A34 [Puccinia triticina]
MDTTLRGLRGLAGTGHWTGPWHAFIVNAPPIPRLKVLLARQLDTLIDDLPALSAALIPPVPTTFGRSKGERTPPRGPGVSGVNRPGKLGKADLTYRRLPSITA